MIELFPVNIATIARCYGLEPKTLFRWYKDFISDYKKDKKNGQFASEKVYELDANTNEIKQEQVVHILEPDNIGESLCIDEKMIDHKYAVIISNQQTGKIVLLIDTIKPVLVEKAIELIPKEKRDLVKYINMDMSPVMKKICVSALPNAKIVTDKFHVIKHILDALQSVRLDIKHSIKTEKSINEKNINGWTDMELLERIRYLLFKNMDELTTEQMQMMENIFSKYPEIKIAYHLCCKIRKWYDKSNIGKSVRKIKEAFYEWRKEVWLSEIKAFKQVVKMMEKHLESIIEYFTEGLTNAKAENINGKIQRFIMNNYGIRNREFFLYRIKVYYGLAPQKKI